MTRNSTRKMTTNNKASNNPKAAAVHGMKAVGEANGQMKPAPEGKKRLFKDMSSNERDELYDKHYIAFKRAHRAHMEWREAKKDLNSYSSVLETVWAFASTSSDGENEDDQESEEGSEKASDGGHDKE